MLAGQHLYIHVPKFKRECTFPLVKCVNVMFYTGFLFVLVYIYIYIYVHFLVYIIIIIIVCCWHKFPRPSPTACPYRPSILGGLPCYILYQYRAVMDRFLLVALLLLIHVRGSTGVHSLWAHLHFSSHVHLI